MRKLLAMAAMLTVAWWVVNGQNRLFAGPIGREDSCQRLVEYLNANSWSPGPYRCWYGEPTT